MPTSPSNFESQRFPQVALASPRSDSARVGSTTTNISQGRQTTSRQQARTRPLPRRHRRAESRTLPSKSPLEGAPRSGSLAEGPAPVQRSSRRRGEVGSRTAAPSSSPAGTSPLEGGPGLRALWQHISMFSIHPLEARFAMIPFRSRAREPILVAQSRRAVYLPCGSRPGAGERDLPWQFAKPRRVRLLVELRTEDLSLNDELCDRSRCRTAPALAFSAARVPTR